MIKSAILANLDQKKVRIIVDGPPLCGKTTTILTALQESGKKYIHLTVNELYGNPSVSPASIAVSYIADGYIIFIDDIEHIFPSRDIDYTFLNRFLSKKPKLIAACRSLSDVNPFMLRYLNMYFKMEQPPTPESEKLTNIPNISFSDIGGSARARDLVLMMASWCVTNSEKVKNWGLKAPSGAMLYGPPGTGKTLLAKAAANACKCRFFSIAIPDLLRCEVGESEKRLTSVFESARADAPSIVFIDEIQALFGRRNERRGDSNRLVVQLIAQLDFDSKHGSVFCLAATNALEAVDPALLQPGRFEEVIEIGYPSKDERIEIIKVALKTLKHNIENANQIESLAIMTDGMTASDIVGICQKAGISTLMDSRNIIEFDDVKKEVELDAFKRAKTGAFSFPQISQNILNRK
ncbi:ATPase, AAA family protein [Tritrichomonas foetus]|uniref:ATPase, AAA family protein n=1 Tax=Tritrichomonas foetus TaxID=1144522 RepID=A0A1J4JJG5_9EUKA|nr:aTPase, AAA family protein [Tritrichomonas foetus]OHS99302.1 ATPase, AAA family protein [Tritrichomonas foetus]|eukprot:OHS99302.1 ATPase, AAA family protein [Tritrichomonas foetus]